MSARIRNFVLLLQRFGALKALEVLGLWTARQVLGFRQAIVYRLSLDRIPPIAGCEQFDWEYEQPHAGGDIRRFSAWHKGERCYSSTVSFRGFSVPERVRIEFNGTNDAYVGDCITEPEHRGKGIYPCALVALAKRLRLEGRTRLYLFVERDNLASIRSVVKAGFEPIGACSIWFFLGRPHLAWRFLTPTAEGEPALWKIELLSRKPPLAPLS